MSCKAKAVAFPVAPLNEGAYAEAVGVFHFIVDDLLGFCYVITPTPHTTVDLKAVLLSQLNSLQTENTTLRWQAPGGQQQLQGPFSRHPPRGGRAISMYETGYSPKQYPHRVEMGRHEDGVILQPFPSNVSRGRPPSGARHGGR